MAERNQGAGGREGGVSRRAVVVAFLLLILTALAAFYVEIAWRRVYMFGAGVPAMAPIATLFLLAGIMGHRRLRWTGLTRRELLAIYSIVLVGGPLVTHGILFWMIPKSIAYFYAARVNTLWETTFLQHVPGWFCPTDQAAVEGFFEGYARVPWSAWWVPLSAWSSFMLALFVCTLCLIVLLRRQWIANERLSFPIAQIPLEMVGEPGGREGGRSGRLSRLWPFWLGFGIVFCIGLNNRLAGVIPAIPSIPLGPIPLMRWQRVGPLAGLGEISMVLTPWMIAIAYLIPKELSFSAWFFWVVRVALTVAAITAGAAPQRPEGWYESSFPAPYYQGGGAAFALALWALWVARPHLRRAARQIFSRGGGRERAEASGYRWALIGLVVSFSWMVGFCLLAGARFLFSFALVGLIVGYYVLWARLRAETGLGFLPFPLQVQDILTAPFGSGALRPREVVTLISTRWAYFPGFGESFEVCTGNALESFKIADAAGINSRRLTVAVLVGFVLSLAVGSYIVLTGIYHYGFSGLGMGSAYGWPSWQTRNDGGRIFEYLTNPSGPDLNGAVAMVAGAATAVMLGAFRLRFWWWPFHPVGYIAANCWGMHWYYMPFFIGWALKSLVVRYGGLRLYRQTIPLAIGMIVGDQLAQAAWSLVALVTRNQI